MNERFRSIIFGGSGFIGTHLANELVRSGSEVAVADLKPPRVSDVEYVPTDVRHGIKHMGSLVRPFDVVYNLAAVHRTPGHPDAAYYDTNVLGAINVTDWARRVGCERVVFTSSISVYGATEKPLDESSALNPTSAYGKSKLMAERVHQQWLSERPGRSLVIVRPAVIFGAGEDGNFSRLGEALRRQRFVYPGRTDTIKSCGYVKDLVDAFVHGLALVEGGGDLTFNFAYPDRYTIEDVCLAFCAVAGFKAPRKLPAGLVTSIQQILAALPGPANHLGQRVGKLTASTNVVPRALEESRFAWRTTLDSALKEWCTDTNGVLR